MAKSRSRQFSLGLSMAIVESQLEAIAESLGPGMAISDGQIEVVVISR